MSIFATNSFWDKGALTPQLKDSMNSTAEAVVGKVKGVVDIAFFPWYLVIA